MVQTATSTALPSAWIDRLFSRLLTLYGRKFADQWGCVDPNELKRAWAEELAGMRAEHIAFALEACKSRTFPPTLPEFLILCGKATTSPEAAFVEAANRWPSRSGWSEPAIYWAAAAIGNDVRRLAWREIQGRWTFALDRARRENKPIPDEVPEERRLTSDAPSETADEARDRVMAMWRSLRDKPPARQREPGQDEQEAA